LLLIWLGLLVNAMLQPVLATAQDKIAFRKGVEELAEAQSEGDEEAVRRIADELKRLLGDRAGTPEAPDNFRPAPAASARSQRSHQCNRIPQSL
jgi:hypothetical protein